jgi:hypothetical protein
MKERGYFLLLDRLQCTLEHKIDHWRNFERAVDGKSKIFLAERLHVAFDVAAALSYLHANNIIYRDLKPDNIGFDVRGMSGCLVWSDCCCSCSCDLASMGSCRLLTSISCCCCRRCQDFRLWPGQGARSVPAPWLYGVLRTVGQHGVTAVHEPRSGPVRTIQFDSRCVQFWFAVVASVFSVVTVRRHEPARSQRSGRVRQRATATRFVVEYAVADLDEARLGTRPVGAAVHGEHIQDFETGNMCSAGWR